MAAFSYFFPFFSPPFPLVGLADYGNGDLSSCSFLGTGTKIPRAAVSFSLLFFFGPLEV